MQDHNSENLTLSAGIAASGAQAGAEGAFASLILNASREAIIGTDEQFIVRLCNQSAADLLEITGVCGQKTSLFDLLPRPLASSLCLEVQRQGIGQAKIPIRNGAGQERIIEVSAARCSQIDGAILGYSFSLRDVSEHPTPTYRQAIEAERALLDKILEHLPSGVIIVDAPDGAVMRANQAALDMFEGQFTFSQSIFEYAHWIGSTPDGQPYRPEDWPAARSILKGEVVTDEEIIFPFDNDIDRTMKINAAPVRDSSGKIIAGVIVVEDITERKRDEEELRGSKQAQEEIAMRFRASVESLLDGFAILSAIRDENDEIVDFRYDYMNETGCQMGYRTKEEVVGRSLLELLPAQRESGLFDRYVELVRTGIPVEAEDHEYEELQDGGKRLLRSFEVRSVKLGDGFVVTWRDITERKHTEEQLKTYAAKLERSNQELDQFALIASHDLQEPLRKIRQFSSSLRHKLGDDLSADAEDSLNRMQRAAERMQAMIDGLLELSRVQTHGGKFEPINLTRLLEDVISDLEPRLESSGGKVLYEPLPEVEVDVVQFRGLLQNLISNALKYHRKGVPPIVQVRGSVQKEDKANPARLLLTVEDNGIGFDEAEAPRIFRAFQRLHGISEYEGTGMGLAICLKIIERHHGKIEVHSRPGEGSTFAITIPTQLR